MRTWQPAIALIFALVAAACGHHTYLGADAASDLGDDAKRLDAGAVDGPTTDGAAMDGSVIDGHAADAAAHDATVAGAPANIVVVSGDGQTAVAGTPLANPFVVVVTDASGNAVSNAMVVFTTTAGGGSLVPTLVTTDGQGHASSMLTLGNGAGINTVQAQAIGSSASPALFSATGTAGPAVALTLVSGDGQSGTAGGALTFPFVVVVTDANANPVSGFDVSYAVTAGGGAMSASPVATDTAGRAAATLTLGNVAGTNTVRAQAAGLTGSPVTFSATGVVGVAASITLVSGNTQTGAVGSVLTSPFTVIVKDAHGNPVSGTTVTWAVTAGGGTISPASSSSATTTGTAQSTFTLGTTAGANLVEARVTGLTGSPVKFTATGLAGPATSIALSSGDGQENLAGATLPSPLVVSIEDAHGNLVSGTQVSFMVTTGNGMLSAGTAITSGGSAQTTLTLGATPGSNKVTATASGVIGSVVFTALGAKIPSYRPHFDFALPTSVHQFAVADINQDGKPDLVFGSGTTSVHMFVNATTTGATTASFRPAVTISLPGVNGVNDLTLTDINADGKPDLILSEGHGNLVVAVNTTIAGATTPTFATPLTITADAHVLKVIDIDGDGRPDIVTNGSLQVDGLTIYLNQTTAGSTSPSFAAGVSFAASGNDLISFFDVADVNGDGAPDMVAATWVPGASTPSRVVDAFINRSSVGLVSYGPSIQVGPGDGGVPLACVDLTGDSRPDIATLLLAVDVNSTPLQSQNPTFGAESDLVSTIAIEPIFALHVTARDVNADGKLDLLVVGKDASSNPVVSVHLNTSPAGAVTASFAPELTFVTGGRPVQVEVADINGDGATDLIVHNLQDQTFSILLAM